MSSTTTDTIASTDADLIEQVVDTRRYPLADPDGAAWQRAVAAIRAELGMAGCSVLRDFVRPERQPLLREQGASVADAAYYDEVTVNVYNTAPDAALPAGHPARLSMRRGNAFVARDCIPDPFIIHRLYTSGLFQRFLAACLDVPRIHPLADPLAGLCLNIVQPGKEHPWHFDTNEFSVSLLTQQAEAGGVFEYCPGIRSARAENLDDVKAVLTGEGEGFIRRLTLRPGDLQLFRGRFSLHRVSPVLGNRSRHTAILSYSERSDVVGRAERTRQLFGRLTAAHRATDTARGDALLD